MIELNQLQLLLLFVLYTGFGMLFGWWLCRYRWKKEINIGRKELGD